MVNLIAMIFLLEDHQYQDLIDVTKQLMNKYPDIKKKSIKGHSDIAPGRKTDPGDKFEWTRYLSKI